MLGFDYVCSHITLSVIEPVPPLLVYVEVVFSSCPVLITCDTGARSI